jgi:hypothetical protein
VHDVLPTRDDAVSREHVTVHMAHDRKPTPELIAALTSAIRAGPRTGGGGNPTREGHADAQINENGVKPLKPDADVMCI